MQLEYYRQVEKLRAMQKAANSKLAELKQASDDARENLTAGMDTSWNSLCSAVKSIISSLK
jgi:hypothetical protein